jgi:ribosomal protein L40E
LGLFLGQICPRCRSQNPQCATSTPPVLFSLLRPNLTQAPAPKILGLSFGRISRLSPSQNPQCSAATPPVLLSQRRKIHLKTLRPKQPYDQ